MGWVKMKLGDVLKNREGRYKPDDPQIEGLKRIDKINFSGQFFLSDKGSNTDMILIKKGDLVISGINVEKGALAVYEGEEDILATIHYSSYIFDTTKIDIDFLKVFLRSPDFIQLLKEQVPGGIKTEIKPKHILPLEVYFPEITIEQKVIAEHFFEKEAKFNQLDEHISYQLNQLENLNQAILQEAVQGKLVNQDPKDEPAIELLKHIKVEKAKSGKKEKPLPPIKPEEIPLDIPKNWVWCRLGEMCINRDGERKPIAQSERNGRKKIYDYYGASGVIDKIDGYTHEGELLLIGEDGANLIARSKPIAFIAKGQFWVNNHAHVIDTVDRITLDYLCCFINSMDLKPYVTGGFQPKLSQGNLNIIPVPLPPIAEQKRIVAEIEKQLAKTKQLKEHIIANQQATEQLLKALLHQAFEVKEMGTV